MNVKKRRGVFNLFLLVVVLQAFGCDSIRALRCGGSVDLASPEKTIETYYDHHANESSHNRAVVSSCFYPPGRYTAKLEKFWLEYEIVEERTTDKAGESLPRGVVVSPSAVEVVVKVKMDHLEKGNPETRFWYLLQEFNGAWKIIQHSHIADEIYPAYD